MTKLFKLLTLIIMTSTIACTDRTPPSEWSQQEIDKWFAKGEWKNGWDVQPDSSIDRRALAISYHKNPERWNKAFAFLKMHDLSAIQAKRYDIQPDTLFAMVNEYTTRSPEESNYEAHKKYIDIQYLVKGEEMIGIAPLSEITDTAQDYDAGKDIGFYKVSSDNKRFANHERFFIFFPNDAHKPNLHPGDSSSEVRKVVVKVMED